MKCYCCDRPLKSGYCFRVTGGSDVAPALLCRPCFLKVRDSRESGYAMPNGRRLYTTEYYQPQPKEE